MSPVERFRNMMTDQIRAIFKSYDKNCNSTFDEYEIRTILKEVFKYSYQEVSQIMRKFPRSYCLNLSYESLITQLLMIKLGKDPFIPDYCAGGLPDPVKPINECEFVKRIIVNCSFVRFKPLECDLKKIFAELSNCRDYILYREYYKFIIETLGWETKDREEKKERKKCVCS